MSIADAQSVKPEVSSAGNTAYVNGFWFDETSFKSETFYSIDGILTLKKPSKVDSVINLKGGYVIPPFGDAHTHNLDRAYQVPALSNQYLQEGTFYVQLLTNKVEGAMELKEYFQKPETVDIKYAHMGITSTLGHPFMAYEPFVLGLYTSEQIEQNKDSIRTSRIDEYNSYIFIDSPDEAEQKLRELLRYNPGAIKIFLLDTENRDKLINDDRLGNHGLAPETAKEVVRIAHENDLKVYAHIETAFDFKLAVDIGVDYLAHMPGYAWDGNLQTLEKYEVSDDLLEQAAEKGVRIIPTLKVGAFFAGDDTSNAKRKVQFQKDFLKRFSSKGGKVLYGSDQFGQTLKSEIMYAHDLGVFNNFQLLEIAVVTTPKTIFPNRKIGEFKEEFEASFLVLDCNPLKEFNCTSQIDMRIKQGRIIEMSEN